MSNKKFALVVKVNAENTNLGDKHRASLPTYTTRNLHEVREYAVLVYDEATCHTGFPVKATVLRSTYPVIQEIVRDRATFGTVCIVDRATEEIVGAVETDSACGENEVIFPAGNDYFFPRHLTLDDIVKNAETLVICD